MKCETCGLEDGHANRCYAESVLISDVRKLEAENEKLRADVAREHSDGLQYHHAWMAEMEYRKAAELQKDEMERVARRLHSILFVMRYGSGGKPLVWPWPKDVPVEEVLKEAEAVLQGKTEKRKSEV